MRFSLGRNEVKKTLIIWIEGIKIAHNPARKRGITIAQRVRNGQDINGQTDAPGFRVKRRGPEAARTAGGAKNEERPAEQHGCAS